MTINMNQDGTKLTVALSGRLDTTTAPDLDAALSEKLDGITELVFDMSGLDYLSSAGLRILLSSHKKMQGKLKIHNANETIMEIFEITGFIDILTIE